MAKSFPTLTVIQSPEATSQAPARTLSTEAGRVSYTCPMHPEIVRDGPGSCPICGMALEAMTVSADDDDGELRDMSRRFWISVALTIPLILLSMLEMVPGLAPSRVVPGQSLIWLQLLLAAPVVLWGGLPFFDAAGILFVSRNLNMFTLIALGTGTAFVFSVVAALVPQMFPESFRDHHGNVGVYFEPAAVIVTLVLLGQVLELRARRQTGSAIRALLGLAPKTARRIGEDGREEDVALELVVPGDRLRIRPGEKIPVDGVVARWLECCGRVDDHRRADPG